MVHRHGDYAFQQPSFMNGDVVEGGNYMQMAPGTLIASKVRSLTIRGGNFVNCKPQAGWVIEGGNWAQVERCSNKNPELVALGLPVCDVNCAHIESTDTIRVDGVVVQTVRTYKNSVSAPTARVTR